ncbi:MAG: hypothetical protein H0U73_02185 [Tatlockia sp.]|nr:hypothetical protein [Tatlockia sp.]
MNKKPTKTADKSPLYGGVSKLRSPLLNLKNNGSFVDTDSESCLVREYLSHLSDTLEKRNNKKERRLILI